ncbi:DNA-binding protein [Microvirga antarctica]|uniref:DNA-binding protein n=1 Tax=Microvirga antarctica TaxID=2819233 RepID=UPI001B305A52|nr:DNA-binding protein [Microvirga antarctica]
MDAEIRMTVRLPASAAQFLDGLAKENFTSRNAEIVRSVRERMDREAQTKTATKQQA